VRVVELSVMVAGPAAGGLLADWGADVTKVEGPGGDGFRSSLGAVAGITGLQPHDDSPSFYMDNRGKKSVILDLKTPEGKEALHRLLSKADVWISNVNRAGVERLGLEAEALLSRHPHLVVCPITAYGRDGPDRDRPGYDVGAFWARSSAAWRHHDREVSHPPSSAPAFGDHVTAITAASGILAALLARERNGGRGDVVTTSLLRAGMYGQRESNVARAACWSGDYEFASRCRYANGWNISEQLAPRLASRAKAPGRVMRTRSGNPLIGQYRTRDGDFIWLLGYEAARHWEPTARALGHPEWLQDARFASARDRAKNAPALTALLDESMGARDAADWHRILDAGGVWWQPVQSPREVTRDPQAAPGFVSIPPGAMDSGRYEIRSVKGPVDFNSHPANPAGPVPAAGQHTEEVLRAAGFGGAQLAALLAAQVKAKL
jgi:crotonobetainyl-CoA:carnitine CoA-transferase CaiB-like acyl-CoA transferase